MFKATTLTVDNLEVNNLTSEGIENAASKLMLNMTLNLLLKLACSFNCASFSINIIIIIF